MLLTYIDVIIIFLSSYEKNVPKIPTLCISTVSTAPTTLTNLNLRIKQIYCLCLDTRKQAFQAKHLIFIQIAHIKKATVHNLLINYYFSQGSFELYNLQQKYYPLTPVLIFKLQTY